MAHKFEKPIKILHGIGDEGTVADVWRATNFLLDWTSRRQGAHYYAALDACSAALREGGPVAEAEEAFRQFAEHVGILVLDAPDMAPDFADFLREPAHA